MRDYLEKIPSPFTFGLEKPMYRALPVGEGAGSTLHLPFTTLHHLEKSCNLTIAYIFYSQPYIEFSNEPVNPNQEMAGW